MSKEGKEKKKREKALWEIAVFNWLMAWIFVTLTSPGILNVLDFSGKTPFEKAAGLASLCAAVVVFLTYNYIHIKRLYTVKSSREADETDSIRSFDKGNWDFDRIDSELETLKDKFDDSNQLEDIGKLIKKIDKQIDSAKRKDKVATTMVNELFGENSVSNTKFISQLQQLESAFIENCKKAELLLNVFDAEDYEDLKKSEKKSEKNKLERLVKEMYEIRDYSEVADIFGIDDLDELDRDKSDKAGINSRLNPHMEIIANVVKCIAMNDKMLQAYDWFIVEASKVNDTTELGSKEQIEEISKLSTQLRELYSNIRA